MIKSLLLLLCLMISCHALFENTYSVKALKSAKKIRQVLYDLDQVALLFFWAEGSENSKQAQSLVEKVADDNEGIFKVFHVDCTEAWNDEEARKLIPICNPELEKQLPQITYYQPPLQRINSQTNYTIPAQEHRFEGEASPKSLSQFGHKLMHAFRVILTSQKDLEQFLSRETSLNKVILFTDKKITSPIYKALTQLFLQRLHFAEVVNGPESNQILDEFDIEEFPQFYLLERREDGQGYTRERYEGDLLWKPLKSFLEQYAAQDKVGFEFPEDIIPQQVQPKPRERRQRGSSEQKTEEQKEEKKPSGPVIVELTQELYEKELLKSEKPALVHLYKNDATHKVWEDMIKKYKSLFNYYTMNVTSQNEQFVKDTLSAKQLPSIRFFAVGNAQKKKVTVVNFGHNMEFEEIQKDILDIVEDKSQGVNMQELQMKLQQSLIENKICLILFYNTATVGLTYRVFSAMNQYQDRFRFISFKNAPQVILDQFSVKNQPQISMVLRDINPDDPDAQELKQDQIRMAVYSGQMQFEDIAQFLSNFEPQKQTAVKATQEVSSQEQMQQACEGNSKICFIGLLNSKHQKINQDDEKTKWEYQLDVLNKIKNKYGSQSVSFVYIDALCHDEILQPLDLSDDFLPNYISYTSSQKQYSKMIGIFDYDSISRFVENQLKGRTQVYSLTQKLTLKTKNCEEVLAQRELNSQSNTSDDSDDDILREILEENRLKQELLEKELKQDKKNAKKNKKNSKKNEL